jgi:DNA-binding response OmpR family regulator
VSTPRILVVDDEEDLRDLLAFNLKREGYHIAQAATGMEALRLAASLVPNVMLLDIGLPDVSGVDVCRRIKATPATRDVAVVMLSARASEADRVLGLEAGAADYVTKPFSLRELTARVRAVLRRGPAAEPRQGRYQGTRLVADFEAVAIAVDGAAVRLTRREFELLQYLVQNKNRVVSRDRLLERVWGYERLVETRSVDVHVGRLRSKLRTAGHQIETVVGLGYRFVD